MAHQIMATDKVYLAETGAWHGHGEVFPEALCGDEVRKLVVPWEPAQRKAYYYDSDPRSGGKLQVCPDRKVIVRGDTGAYLGTVGDGYSLMGNKEMFDLVEEALPGCKYETAGTLFGQRRVWALAQIGAHEPIKGDRNLQYLMVANGHDGSFRLFFGRTDVRVVCNNTLTAAISGGNAKASEGVVAYKHTSRMKSRVQDAAKAIGKARESAKLFASQAATLAKVKLSKKEANAYFLSVFPAPKAKANGKAVDGASVLSSVLEREEADRDIVNGLLRGHREESKRTETRHANILQAILDNYGSERCAGQFGGNAWTALNAVTDYVDHSRATRGTDDTDRAENRFASTVWGSGNDLKQVALQNAMKLV
jgi:phage/plasmid-like protein (TIGR03299 family)